MKLSQNTSGNHLNMRTEEALELIANLSKAIADAQKAPPTAGGSFTTALILRTSPAIIEVLERAARQDAPSVLHIFVEKRNV